MMEKKRKRQIGNMNLELPSSIMEVIFSKLPFYVLPVCRIVCREWNDLILASKFDSEISISSLFFFADRYHSDNLHCMNFDIEQHLKLVRSVASFNFPPKLSSGGRFISIVNCCNGLLCLLIKKFDGNVITPRAVCVLNPMTNEFFKLPILKPDRGKNYHYGLGFSPKTKEYKLIRSSLVSLYLKGTHIEIFAFGTTRKWTSVDFLYYLFNFNEFFYFNGGIYLVTKNKDCVIYRLDVEEERMKEISYPKDEGLCKQIVELNDTLYLTTNLNDYHFHVWAMREDFSWIKAFVFPVGSIKSIHFKLLKVYGDGKILCEHKDFGVPGLILYHYDPMSEKKEILAVRDPKIKRIKSFHEIGFPNFNSLFKILAGNSDWLP